MTAIIVIAAVCIGSIVSVCWMTLKARPGWEGENGFCEGEE